MSYTTFAQITVGLIESEFVKALGLESGKYGYKVDDEEWDFCEICEFDGCLAYDGDDESIYGVNAFRNSGLYSEEIDIDELPKKVAKAKAEFKSVYPNIEPKVYFTVGRL